MKRYDEVTKAKLVLETAGNNRPVEVVAQELGVNYSSACNITERARKQLNPRKTRKDKGKLRPERTKEGFISYIKSLPVESSVEKRDKKSFLDYYERPFERTIVYIKVLIDYCSVSTNIGIMKALESMVNRSKKYHYDYNKDIIVDVKVADFVRRLIFDEKIYNYPDIIRMTKLEFVGYGK